MPNDCDRLLSLLRTIHSSEGDEKAQAEKEYFALAAKLRYRERAKRNRALAVAGAGHRLVAAQLKAREYQDAREWQTLRNGIQALTEVVRTVAQGFIDGSKAFADYAKLMNEVMAATEPAQEFIEGIISGDTCTQ